MPALTDQELVIREARRRQRRRWVTGFGVFLAVVAAALVVALATSGSDPTTRATGHAKPSAGDAHPVIIPIGSPAALRSPGPLAVSESDLVYVVDPSQHRVVVRLASGQFYDVVGDGQRGPGGDGGPALKAEVGDVSDIAFAPNGDLYIADGARVRVVGESGVITSLAGDGLPGGHVAPGTPARSAHLGTVQSIAFSPSGQLFIATQNQILRLSSRDQLEPIKAEASSGPRKGPLSQFGSIAVDRRGDIYASTGFTGWSVYRITPSGDATYLGYARRSGGNLAILRRNAGQIEADDGPSLLVVKGASLVHEWSVNNIPGVSNFNFMNYFAVTPGGGFVADNLGQGFDRYQQIVSAAVGQGYSMWIGPTEPQGQVNAQLAQEAAQQAAQQAAEQQGKASAKS